MFLFCPTPSNGSLSCRIKATLLLKACKVTSPQVLVTALIAFTMVILVVKTLRVPWTAKRSNHSILKEINPEYSLEGLVLKLKLQYCGHLIQRAD